MQPANYSLIDFGNGKRLESWGPYILVRPDPSARGIPNHADRWNEADAIYEGEKGKGQWKKFRDLPEYWTTTFGDLQLSTQLTPYKHTGIFPEQQANWNFARDKARGRKCSILNLFAYTGGASVALAKDGHIVTHVDAAKPSIARAKENAAKNGIESDGIRWILDDAALFAARELKRGKTYDGIILDPPAYGHSPSGKTWRSERDLRPLLETCAKLLSETPAFFILNVYAQHDTPADIHRLLTGVLHTHVRQKNFEVSVEELYLRSEDGRRLSTGIVARVRFKGCGKF